MKRTLLWTVTLAFTAYSLVVGFTHGYTGFFTLAAREPWAPDLAIALTLVLGGLLPRVRSSGGRWLLVVGTVALGSIAPLWYLATRSRGDA